MGFLSWMANPMMLGMGALAVSLPIIIHLLNKRKFKIVNWAAMDFLFDADKKNRRRVRLENFLLLLLRCLIMFLIGLMLARPFLPSSIAKNLSKTQRYERVVMLDDSLSQMVKQDNQTSFELAKEKLKGLLNRAVDNESDDSLTLFLMSDPDKPVAANKPITLDSLDGLAGIIDDLVCSDLRVDYPACLNRLNDYVSGQTEELNRVIYVVSDLRSADWNSLEASSESDSPGELVAAIGDLENVAGAFVVDVGNDGEENLTIVEIRTEDLLVADTVIRFSVKLRNNGSVVARDVGVRFNIGDQPPMVETVAELAPGQEKTLTYRFMFNQDRSELDDLDIDKRLRQNAGSFLVHAEIIQDGVIVDELRADSLADFAASVLNGTPILLVDGDPNRVPSRSETHYLQSVEVKGTGWLQDTNTRAEFESAVSLSKYRVIFLCNVDEFSTDRVKALEQWVADGNSLVFMPGNKVRAEFFNAAFFKDGNGLSPVSLVKMDGDRERRIWHSFDVDQAVHPALQRLTGVDNVFSTIKVFNWWSTQVPAEPTKNVVTVPIRLDDDNNSILMAEKSFGGGRVITFAVPADIEWTFWPAHPSFSPIMYELVKYLVSGDDQHASVQVGNPVAYPVDLSMYDRKVALIDPAEEKIEDIAMPFDESIEAEKSILYQVRFDSLPRRGVYELRLSRENQQTTESIYFAANVDPREGQLKRVDLNVLANELGEEVKLISGEQMENQTVSGGQNEIWVQLLVLLGCMLCLEQFLGWWFGRRR